MAHSQRRTKLSYRPLASIQPRGAFSLQELLRELAFLLLAHGMTPKTFGELSRSAFVQAAADHSKLRNGRVNYSRVAAQTGLTRADVKRLLSRGAHGAPLAVGQTAMERVIDGWRSDRRFSSGPGSPRILRILGPKPSFLLLARKYAGDVPYRAVLDELQRIRAVKVHGESVQLKRSSQLRRRHDFGFLTAIVPVLIDGLRIASEVERADPAASMHRLLIPVGSELDLAFVRERCTTTAKAMLDGLSHSLGTKVTTVRRGRNLGSSFAVTIFLTENRTKRIQREAPISGKRSQHGY
jgi:hypothetical protein